MTFSANKPQTLDGSPLNERKIIQHTDPLCLPSVILTQLPLVVSESPTCLTEILGDRVGENNWAVDFFADHAVYAVEFSRKAIRYIATTCLPYGAALTLSQQILAKLKTLFRGINGIAAPLPIEELDGIRCMGWSLTGITEDGQSLPLSDGPLMVESIPVNGPINPVHWFYEILQSQSGDNRLVIRYVQQKRSSIGGDTLEYTLDIVLVHVFTSSESLSPKFDPGAPVTAPPEFQGGLSCAIGCYGGETYHCGLGIDVSDWNNIGIPHK